MRLLIRPTAEIQSQRDRARGTNNREAERRTKRVVRPVAARVFPDGDEVALVAHARAASWERRIEVPRSAPQRLQARRQRGIVEDGPRVVY